MEIGGSFLTLFLLVLAVCQEAGTQSLSWQTDPLSASELKASRERQEILATLTETSRCDEAATSEIRQLKTSVSELSRAVGNLLSMADTLTQLVNESQVSQLETAVQDAMLTNAKQRQWLENVTEQFTARLGVMNHTIDHCDAQSGHFREFMDARYILVTRPGMTWEAASRRCQECGYRLVDINYEDEQEFIQNWLDNIPNIDSAWLGGTDQGQGSRWRWTQSHAHMTFTDWAERQPRGSRRCLAALRSRQWKWYAEQCTQRYPFICKKSPRAQRPLLGPESCDDCSSET